MNLLRPSTRFTLFLAGAAGIIALTASMGLALSGGIDEERAVSQGGSIEVGCTCHAPVPTPSVRPVLLGVPGVYGEPAEEGGEYTPGTYNLTVRLEGGEDGRRGGFNLHVTGGTLAVAEGEDGAQVLESGDATHTRPSDTLSWNLTWTAPDEPAEGVVFRLTVNSVNDVPGPDPEDQWNRLTVASQGAEGAQVGAAAEDEGIHVEGLGVNWLAYWVGIASFVFLGIILLLYYFVFKYSETTRTTDHRARKDKIKGKGKA